MNNSSTQRSSDDHGEDYFLDIILYWIGDKDLSPDTSTKLSEIVSDAYTQYDLSEQARTLEFEENCVLLGKQIRSSHGESEGAITAATVGRAILVLCPGLWPFC